MLVVRLHAYAHIICQWTDMTFWPLSDNFDPPHDQGIDAMQATRGFRNKFNRSIKEVGSLLFWKLCCSCVFWLLISYQRWFTMIPSPLEVVSVSESCFGAYKVAILGRFVRRTLEWSGTMAAGRRGRGQWTSAEPILMQELILLTSMFCVAACIYITLWLPWIVWKVSLAPQSGFYVEVRQVIGTPLLWESLAGGQGFISWLLLVQGFLQEED